MYFIKKKTTKERNVNYSDFMKVYQYLPNLFIKHVYIPQVRKIKSTKAWRKLQCLLRLVYPYIPILKLTLKADFPNQKGTQKRV